VILWIDAQLSPALAPWIEETFAIEARSVKCLGLRDARDREIFLRAREAGAIVLTKDADFPLLLKEFGPPPQVLWLTAGNTSNIRVREILSSTLPRALVYFAAGEPLVQINDSGTLPTQT
jgi:predicted nuclease of predicted toxin-antitoxin system